MSFGAITIDTNIIIEAGYKFDGPLLSSLSQFESGPVSFVLSSIVFMEIHANYKKFLSDETKKIAEACRRALDVGLINGVPNHVPIENFAKQKLDAFVNSTGCIIVHHNKVKVSELMKLYFQSKPPFGDKDKKSEFPDAIALLSLRDWAESEGKTIIAVSKDKGWEAFARDNNFLKVVESLSEALNLVNQNLSSVRDQILALIRGDGLGLGQFYEKAVFALNDRLSMESILINMQSEMHVEDSLVGISVTDWSFASIEDDLGIRIISVAPDKVSFAVDLDIEVEIDCDFSFYIYDGVDKEYVPFGGSNKVKSFRFESEVVFEVVYFKSPQSASISGISINRVPSDFDFGVVSIDHEEEGSMSADADDFSFDLSDIL